MGRVKISDLMRKKSVPISLSTHIEASLQQLDNKSQVVEEILIENMDRINCGDIEASIKAKEVQVRELVIKVLMENESKLLEHESSIAKLQEMMTTLQEISHTSKGMNKDFKGIAQDIHAITSKIKLDDFKLELVNSITQKIYDDTEEYAKSFYEV